MLQHLFLLVATLTCVGCAVSDGYVVPNEPPVEIEMDTCQQPLDRGSPGENSGIKYFFDPKLSICFAYFFEGDNGGVNSFETFSSCQSTCIPQDFFTCAAGEPSDSLCYSDTRKCEKEGFKCLMGPFDFGFCCNATIEDAFEREYSPSECSDGRSVSVDKDSDPIIGRSCEDKFCPESADCAQGKWISHCCEGKVSDDSYSIRRQGTA